MCFDLDSRPPIAPIAGGSLDAVTLTLDASDGTRFAAFRARATTPTGAAVLIMPDVRGLHPYYEELALRFAENGVDALAIDYFGRTAGIGDRNSGFAYMPHVNQLTWDGLTADVRAGAEQLRMRNEGRTRALFTIGFCMGGRLAFLTPTLGLELAGAIGLYGIPVGEGRAGMPAPADVAGDLASPVLGLFGGEDPSIPSESVEAFETALEKAGVDHRIVVYDGAPHSFFDRKAEEFADASRQAWDEILTFIRARTPSEIA